MTTITVTLPDDLAKKAKAKGLLSEVSLVMLITAAVENDDVQPEKMDPDFTDVDPRVKDLVNPAAFRKGMITGDIIGPFNEVWEEGQPSRLEG